MINIKEDITTKIPGETSLYVSFNYNPEIIETIKQLNPVVYNKDTKVWEIPIYYIDKYLLCQGKK